MTDSERRERYAAAIHEELVRCKHGALGGECSDLADAVMAVADAEMRAYVAWSESQAHQIVDLQRENARLRAELNGARDVLRKHGREGHRMSWTWTYREHRKGSTVVRVGGVYVARSRKTRPYVIRVERVTDNGVYWNSVSHSNVRLQAGYSDTEKFISTYEYMPSD